MFIRHPQTSRCISRPTSGEEDGDGAEIQLEDCQDLPRMKWTRRPDNSWANVATPDQCLDIFDQDEPELYTWRCNGGGNQTGFKIDDKLRFGPLVYSADKRWTPSSKQLDNDPMYEWRAQSSLPLVESKSQQPSNAISDLVASFPALSMGGPLSMGELPSISRKEKESIDYVPFRAWRTFPQNPSMQDLQADFKSFVSENRPMIVSTYNVHYWTSAHERCELTDSFNTIKRLNADVLLLQEVSLGINEFCKRYPALRGMSFNSSGEFIDWLKAELGYDEAFFCETADWYGQPFGNLTLVRKPYTVSTHQHMYLPVKDSDLERRCATRILVSREDSPSKQMAIYNVHLEAVDTPEEKWRLTELKAIARQMDAEQIPAILGGDFNSLHKDDYPPDVWDWMVKSRHPVASFAQDYIRRPKSSGGMGLVDSFTISGLDKPPLTSWSGRAIDFLYFNDKWPRGSIQDSWMTFSDTSDHLPISAKIRSL